MDCGMRSTFHKESFSDVLIICFFSPLRMTFWRSFETNEDETVVKEEVKSKKVNCVEFDRQREFTPQVSKFAA